MRLVAIYTKDHFLFSESLVNLGGKYIYNIQYKQENKYEVIRTPNSNYIENFWSNNISLVSAIVGENGAGKTSVFRNLNKIFSPYDRQDRMFDAIFIFENLLEDSYCYFSEKFEIDEVTKIQRNQIETIYYSPVIDYDLTDINSPISLIYHYSDSISTFYLQNIQRHLFFLKNTELVENLKKSYDHFPFYEKLIIKANSLYKDDFEKVYIQTTIGNNFYRVRNDLMELAKYKPYCFSSEDAVEEYFNNHKGVQEELHEIWDIYKNSEETSHLLHDGKDFKKNLEVNLLSFLVINDTFTMNNDNGGYDFNKILEAENFTDKLHHFFNKYIIQTSKFFYNILLNGKDELNIKDSEILLEELKNNNNLIKGKISGFEKVYINEAIKKHIIIFKNILDFIEQINQFIDDDSTTEFEGGLEIDIQKLDLEAFNKFIKTYEFLKDELTDSLPNKSRDILEIRSTKKLSTGEKALIDLYSSIYDYLKALRDHQYNENCIFLLDEADLGFHPEWKKRYINALTTTLPILINSLKDKIKNIQIIFATHDPLTLSDIPNTNVVYLKKEPATTKVLSEGEKPTKSFGANITDLLADSFFIKDGLIGDFAKEKIDYLIKYLNGDESSLITDKIEAKKIIDIIDEPVLKYKLEDMYFEKFPEEYNKEKEIEELMRKAQELGLNIQR
ncbi:AAA family ATPase [Chryseobacterium mucoviscidosis]|uniref:AAA family ATPase n=1 Tax=Chryseobacterium mucoviscidosis TaxID=1945581 RepID=UPI0031DA670B